MAGGAGGTTKCSCKTILSKNPSKETKGQYDYSIKCHYKSPGGAVGYGEFYVTAATDADAFAQAAENCSGGGPEIKKTRRPTKKPAKKTAGKPTAKKSAGKPSKKPAIKTEKKGRRS